MAIRCPLKCRQSKVSGRIVRFGGYYRTSDRCWIQRYKCAFCGKHFSQATFSPCFNQKKRHLNDEIEFLLVSKVSQRRIARRLKIHQVTVARKLKFLGEQARHFNYLKRQELEPLTEIQFDELETIEHTKMKPLSVPLVVDKKTRFIVGFEVCRMPAKGLLAKKSFKKYGLRADERREARKRLFRRIHSQVSPNATIQSDQNPHYPEIIKEYFPKASHIPVKGQRGAVTGQGELKKIAFDPLFSLNHTCAMLRDNINRLIRKTWCTTKKIQPLIDHIELYVKYHNHTLLNELPLTF